MGPASLRASVLGWHHASRAWQRRSPHGWTCRRVQVGMAVRDRALNPTGAGSGAFLHLWSEPDPHRTRFGCGFHFSPVGAPETRKKLKTQKKPEKPERNPKPPKETHLQNPTGTRTRPKTRRVRVPNFTPGFGFDVKFNPTTFFTGRIFDQPDPNLTSCHP
jgi:hypothetical protein